MAATSRVGLHTFAARHLLRIVIESLGVIAQTILIATVGLLSCSLAMADSTSAWRIGGIVDVNAQHTVDAQFRSLFGLELIMLDVRYTTADVRARMALHAGQYVNRNYTDASFSEGSTLLLRSLHAAYAGVRIADEIWVDVGLMPSHIGNETAVSSENITYTRSIIAESSPYFETGARVSWQISRQLYAAVLALNGWQNIEDYDNEIAFGSLIVFEPAPQWKFGWSTFIGDVRSSSGVHTTRYFNDVYASYTTSDLTIATAFDIGTQELPPIGYPPEEMGVWYGATLQGKLQFDSIIAFNARIESFTDIDRVMYAPRTSFATNTGPPYCVIGGSLGLDITPRKYTQLRFEARMLHATRDIFVVPGADLPQQFRSNQLWFTAALVVTVP